MQKNGLIQDYAGNISSTRVMFLFSIVVSAVLALFAVKDNSPVAERLVSMFLAIPSTTKLVQCGIESATQKQQ